VLKDTMRSTTAQAAATICLCRRRRNLTLLFGVCSAVATLDSRQGRQLAQIFENAAFEASTQHACQEDGVLLLE
jgi:hypothetical protein